MAWMRTGTSCPAREHHQSRGRGRQSLYALQVAVMLLLSVPLGQNNALRPAIAHASTWYSQSRGTGQSLLGVACPSTRICYAVGDGGTIVVTRNGGYTWSRLISPTGQSLNGVACAGTRICYAVGDGGTIVATRDASRTWSRLISPPRSHALRGIACPSTRICYAVGDGGTIVAYGMVSSHEHPHQTDGAADGRGYQHADW
jgi:photosystem II stability/assembly factor-like uncharacterized protein